MTSEATDDPAIIARNIRTMRSTEGLTQRELAKRAGISEVTLYYAENGKRIRTSTLMKIAEALNQNIDELRSKRSRILAKDGDFVVHRDADIVWFKSEDLRRVIPDDSFTQIQEESERKRLGQLGFVPMFYATPNFIMTAGPGITVLELYNDYTGFNSRLYENCIVYCLRGTVKIQIGDEDTFLEERDAFGYNNVDDMTIGPAKPVEGSDEPPLVLWIGANRKGRLEFDED